MALSDFVCPQCKRPLSITDAVDPADMRCVVCGVPLVNIKRGTGEPHPSRPVARHPMSDTDIQPPSFPKISSGSTPSVVKKDFSKPQGETSTPSSPALVKKEFSSSSIPSTNKATAPKSPERDVFQQAEFLESRKSPTQTPLDTPRSFTRRRVKTREFSKEKVDPLQKKPTKRTVLPSEPGTKEFGKFRLLKPLGEGGMGTVYKALNTRLNRAVALKMIRSEFADDEETMRRFHREAAAAAELIHPNIVSLLSSGDEQGQHYLELEFVDGPSAESLVKSKGKLDVPLAVKIIRDAARGLKEAHAHHIIHRDVKPDNILLSSDGNAKIADFGLAKGDGDEVVRHTLMTQLTQAGMAIGTPHYMSPEQCEGAAADSRSDVYSLGCTFYFLLTGEPPFPGDDLTAIMHRHLVSFPESPSKRNPEITPDLNDILFQMLSKDPDKRQPDMMTVINQLNALRTESDKTNSESESAKKDQSVGSYFMNLFGK